MKQKLPTVLFGVFFFLSIGMFRGISLGQNIPLACFGISVFLAFVLGAWLIIVKKT
ncbi:hypothetical protein [Thiolapillus sp.]